MKGVIIVFLPYSSSIVVVNTLSQDQYQAFTWLVLYFMFLIFTCAQVTKMWHPASIGESNYVFFN